MASASRVRGPHQSPKPISGPEVSPGIPSSSSVSSYALRRSYSRVFYDLEDTTETSWEFCVVPSTSRHFVSPTEEPLYYHNSNQHMNMNLSVLRSPQMMSSSTNGFSSPMPAMIASADTSSIHHRSIPSPPHSIMIKDDLSDGSRNSTGSSTGSHRSQDSGFSDSGEQRHARKGLSIHAQNAQSSIARCQGECCKDANANKNSLNQSRNIGSATFSVHNGTPHSTHSHQYQELGVQSAVHPCTPNGTQQHYHSHIIHERCYSTPVPSPIPHHTSGRGRVSHGSTITLTKNGPHQSFRDYGEINGNNTYNGSIVIVGGHPNLNTKTECANCIYQEVVVSQNQQTSPTSQAPMTQTYVYHHPLSNANLPETGNYAVYSAISPEPGSSAHLGAPICSSTPKRSNLSGYRLNSMQKIDNFESLNKNMRSLDNNNNSSNGSQHSRSQSTSSILSTSGKKKSSSKSTLHCSQNSAEKSRDGGPSFSKHSKNSSKSSLPTGSLNHSQKEDRASCTQTSTNASSNSGFSNFSRNANKTVVQRGALPLPPMEVEPLYNSAEISHTYASQSQVLSPNTSSKSKWSSLPKGYKRVSSKDLATTISSSTASEDVVVVKSHFDNDAMRLWLHELRSQTENECCYMLQTKAILPEGCPTGGEEDQTHVPGSDSDSGTFGSDSSEKKKSKNDVVKAIHGISAPLKSIKNVEEMANIVSAEFSKICKNIEFGFLSQVPRFVISLINYVEEFLRTFQNSSSSFPNLQKLENKLSRACRRLHRSTNQMIELSGTDKESFEPRGVHSIIESENVKKSEGYHVAVNEVVDGIVAVGNLFSQVVDLRLTRDLSCILDIIEGGGVPANVALKSFVNVLMDGGNHLCRLASEIRTVRGLLGVTLDAKDDHLRILSLRCLATILCVGEAVKDFDRASGFEIIADFMYDPAHSLDLKLEAVSVLTQATDPWIDLETSLCTLGPNLEKILVALTNLIPACQFTEEAFLLLVAAISNLTFLEVSSIEILRNYNTMSYVIGVIESLNRDFSVFVLDHVATILANMAGVESCRDSLVKARGVQALLKFLQKHPTPTNETPAEIMACERVQQKSTIAISRLCTEEGVAKLIVEKGGLNRLIQLCRNEKERNYSDGVLIAALATLRKLVGICGEEVVRGLQADDLIQPRLLDSFLLYSSRQESYV